LYFIGKTRPATAGNKRHLQKRKENKRKQKKRKEKKRKENKERKEMRGSTLFRTILITIIIVIQLKLTLNKVIAIM